MPVKHPNPKRAEKHGAYFTPTSATELLLNAEAFPQKIWEPAAGKGHISEVLLDRGFDVISSDKYDWGYQHAAVSFDFLTQILMTETHQPTVGGLITNPPFALADAFVLRGIELGFKKIALFNKLSWLAGKARHARLWNVVPPDRVLILAKRVTCWRLDDPEPRSTGGSTDYAWFVWDDTMPKALVKGNPVIRWLV